MFVKPDEGLLYFLLYKSTHVVSAYKQAKEIVVSRVFDKNLMCQLWNFLYISIQTNSIEINSSKSFQIVLSIWSLIEMWEWDAQFWTAEKRPKEYEYS